MLVMAEMCGGDPVLQAGCASSGHLLMNTAADVCVSGLTFWAKLVGLFARLFPSVSFERDTKAEPRWAH